MDNETESTDSTESTAQDRALATAYGAGLALGAQLADANQRRSRQEDAVDLTIEYRPTRQALLWVVEWNGSLSCWSERGIQEAIGGLALVHMETEHLIAFSMLEYGINFDGFNYNTQDDLGKAVLTYLAERGYRFSQETLDEPTLILCGLGDDDQAPATEPHNQQQTRTLPHSRAAAKKKLWNLVLEIIELEKQQVGSQPTVLTPTSVAPLPANVAAPASTVHGQD